MAGKSRTAACFFQPPGRYCFPFSEITLQKKKVFPLNFVKRPREDEFIRQTANYQLPLWDAADRILREDFNRGNQRLDAELAAVRSEAVEQAEETAAGFAALRAELPYIKIAEVTAQTAAMQINVEVGGLNFDLYRRVELDIYCPAMGKTLWFRVNGQVQSSIDGTTDAAKFWGQFYGGSSEYPSGQFRLNSPIGNARFFCRFESTSGPRANSGCHVSAIRWNELTTLNILL